MRSAYERRNIGYTLLDLRSKDLGARLSSIDAHSNAGDRHVRVRGSIGEGAERTRQERTVDEDMNEVVGGIQRNRLVSKMWILHMR
jgi:hypothetical protein